MSYLDNKGVERLWAHITAKLGDKVTKEEGKGLSSNDFTTAEKTKLANLTAPSITSTGAGNAVTNISVSGSTFTVEKNADFLTEHPYITKYADTSSTASPAHSETFTAVDSISRDENGHVEKINVKTITLPEYTLAGLMGSTAKGSATLPVYWTGSAWATITSYSGKASTAGTADKVANALSINGKTYDGSAAIDVGVIDAAHGGTGQTSLLNSANALINALNNETSTPVDADYFITGGATYHRRPMSALYAYMKGKMDSVYQAKGTVPMASSTALGGVKVGSGLIIAADGTLNHSNSITAKTAYGSAATTASADGGTITLTDVQYDAQGHITGSTDRTITLSQRATTLEELGIDTFDKLNTKYGLDDKYKIAPDWNENDSASKNYINNRPGAFTKTETITLTATAESGDSSTTTITSLAFAFPDERMDLIPGETYQVVWDGQTYNWEAKVFYLNPSTHEVSTTYIPHFMPLYIICGHMLTGDATDSFPITVVSAGGSFDAREIPKGMLIVRSNETSFTVGTSYSITITGKFDYKLYSWNGNNVYATGIFDNATLVMAMNYTDVKTNDFVSKSGDTMTGDLNIQGYYNPFLSLVPIESSKIKKSVFSCNGNGILSMAIWEDESKQNGRIFEVRAKPLENSLNNALLLRVYDNGNQSSYEIFHSGMTNAIPISQGGTGATTAAGALTALGAFPISGGTLTGAAMAGADAQKTLSTAQLRNITISTTDLVEGESTLAEGEVYLVYNGGVA